MKNNDTTKIVIGVVIGGVIGGGLFCLYNATRDDKTPILNKVGQAITDLGEMLEDCSCRTDKEAIDEIGKTIPKGDSIIHNTLNLVATGIHLYKQIKKGL